MTTDFSYAASENFHAGTKSSRKIEKGLKRILVITGILIIAELVWLFGISPFIPFSTIEVYEIDGFRRDEILYLAGIGDSSSFMSTNVSQVREKLSANILVESVKVIKRFPDKLSIFISPRQEVAVTLSHDGSRQQMVYVDRHGVYFKAEKAEHAAWKNNSLPVLSGIENPQVGMRLPASVVPLVESISVIHEKEPQILAAVSEIRIERKGWDGFDLVLFPVHSPVKVRIENNLTGDILRYILLMLNVFETSGQKPQEIDFRSGMGSFKTEGIALWQVME